ncbi:MAG: hypothetical protein IAE78_12790 [Myxococcus sp.]|nr:hypothetical protein [Myxococcus sp.]
MKHPWLAALLNFFFMGPGTLYVGQRKLLGAVLTLGALSLTYVELSLQKEAPALYPIMFGTVLVMNTFFAIDGWREAKAVNAGKV